LERNILKRKGIDFMKKTFYDEAVQVMFRNLPDEFDPSLDTETTFGGIAFGGTVICGCCGKVIRLEDIDILEELPWVNISEEIILF
jgi:hypothetical protein